MKFENLLALDTEILVTEWEPKQFWSIGVGTKNF